MVKFQFNQSRYLPTNSEPVADNYFESLPDDILNKAKLSMSFADAGLEEESTKNNTLTDGILSKKIKLPYSVDDNYFENFSQQILKNNPYCHQKSFTFFTPQKRTLSIFAVACATAVITSLVYLIYGTPNTTEPSYSSTNVNKYKQFNIVKPMNEKQVIASLNDMTYEDILNQADSEHIIDDEGMLIDVEHTLSHQNENELVYNLNY